MRALVPLFLVLAACGGATPPPLSGPEGPVRFRVLSEKQNPTFCVEGPEFAVATTEEAWIDVFARQTECRPDDEVRVPEVAFDREIAVAAWWKVAGCLGFDVRTTSVRREGASIIVAAETKGPGPDEICATALGSLESFLALERSELVTGNEPVIFVLDGARAGEARAR